MVALWLMAGCYLSHERPPVPLETRESVPDARDAGPGRSEDLGARDASDTDDAGPGDAGREDSGPGDAGPLLELPCEQPVGVDLLFVLDDSGSIRPRDGMVRRRMEQIVMGLLSPPDLNRDGVEDSRRVIDLHVGVTTSSVQGPVYCPHGRDGRLMRGEPADFPECSGIYPAVLRYPEMGSPEEVAEALSCIAFGPRDGCTIEQPLEAIAKALLPEDAPFDFVQGTGRGDTDNAGFLREDSVLVVVIVADEDDCSVVDPGIFVPRDAGPLLPPRPAIGCLMAGEGQLHPTTRYLDVLEYLRPLHPDRVVFAMIASFTEPVVLDVRESFGVGCEGEDFPTRMIEVARGIPDQSVAGSLCTLESPVVAQTLTQRIAAAACED